LVILLNARFENVVVVGAGTMGHGIAELAAMSGYTVYLADVNEEILRNAMSRIKWSLEKLRDKGRLGEDVESILARIRPVISVGGGGEFSEDLKKALEKADIMIEAIPEVLELKQKLFAFADRNASGRAILATNTSSLPITEIASATEKPERVVGMHFFNPPVLMPLVEIIRGEKTGDDAVKASSEFAKSLGKQVVVVNKDVPGFIVNRILGRFLNTGCLLVEEKVASIEEIDATAVYELGLPMGVFELADYSGIDVFYLVFEAMSKRGFSVRPCGLFKEKYEAKEYGVKSGRGFYTYPEPGKYSKPAIDKGKAGKIEPAWLLAPAVNEAAWLVRNGVATVEDIDKAVKLGLNWPRGVLEFADDYGIDTIVSSLEELKEKLNNGSLEPDPLLREKVERKELGRKSGRGFYNYEGIEERRLETLILRIEKPVAWIILNRPNKLNSITPKMLEELSQTLEILEEDERVRSIIIRGAGRAFSAGADITSFTAANPIEILKFSRKFQEVTMKIQRLAKPVIVAIHGYALGGGLELAMSGDIRIASEDAMLGQPEINLGFIPGAGGTQRLPRIVGVAKAKEIIMTGDMIPAKEAERIGLVNKVVAPERLEGEARNLALKLAEKPPIALAYAKLAIDRGIETSLENGLLLEATLFSLLFNTEDVIEGVTAFMEKRKPKFKGK